MPAVSEAQRRYLFWRFGPAWARRHHYDNKGRLPARAATTAAVIRRLKGA